MSDGSADGGGARGGEPAPPSGLETSDRYRFEWTGDLPARALSSTYDPGAVAELGPAQRAELERMLARRAAAGEVLIRRPDGALPDLYRLLSFEASARELRFRLGRTDYAEYLLTNVEHPEWRRELGPQAMSDALAASLVLVTADGRVPWGRRSRRILDARACAYHVLPSGHPEPPGSLVAGLLDEAREETGVEPGELFDLCCTGLLRSSASGKPELTFRARTSVTFDAMLARERAGAWEFDELYTLPWRAADVARWLVLHRDDAVPPGHAALLMAGRAAFGAAWAAEVLRALARPQLPPR